MQANIGSHIGYYTLDNNTKVKNNFSFQPRLSVRYLLAEDWSIKGSYAKMQQNIHLLSNSSVGFPSDIWVPAIDSNRNPQQWAGNITTQLFNGQFELSLEGYYKSMKDLIAYKALFKFRKYRILGKCCENWWRRILARRFFYKKKGKTTGWIGYSWHGQTESLKILTLVSGFRINMTEDMIFLCAYKINESVDIGLTWVYGTGNAFTFPQGLYLGMPQNGWDNELFVESVESYGNRNSTRLPSYHRLSCS